MKALALSYFKDDREQWHQPGNIDDFSPEEAEKHEAAGAIRIIRTAMAETPETRTSRGDKDEAHHQGRKRIK